MSHFYASIPTSARKTVPTASGDKSTGIETRAASYAGAITVSVWHNVDTGQDHFRVCQNQHYGAGINKIISEGIVGL